VSLRILHVSSFDTAGGAALAAYRLHRGLIAKDHDSRMLVARRDSHDDTVSVPISQRDLRSRALRRFRRRRIRRELEKYANTKPDWPERFSDDRAWREWEHGARLGSFDVVNLHWISGLLDYRRFFDSVPPDVPVIWTLHDMNTFTGGCHYDAGCERFRQQCGVCPQLGSRHEYDLSRDVWLRKEELFSGINAERLHFVTPSRWLADEVRNASLLGDRFPVSVIPNGVNTEEFAPRDRTAARDVLGVPRESKVILFLAYSLAARRKGFAVLTEALNELSSDPDLVVLSVGAGEPSDQIPVRQIHLGTISQARLLSLAYNAADLFVIPSQQDNLPTTVLEALACGTPIVGFDVGGVPDMVRPGKTGALVPVGDPKALAGTMRTLLEDSEARERMSRECRRLAIDEYHMDTCVGRYETLYRDLVGA